tara:strand:+ start:353 stop:535 length:183 start_codon:yes stop_codon:yes gene_type:complete
MKTKYTVDVSEEVFKALNIKSEADLVKARTAVKLKLAAAYKERDELKKAINALVYETLML